MVKHAAALAHADKVLQDNERLRTDLANQMKDLGAIDKVWLI